MRWQLAQFAKLASISLAVIAPATAVATSPMTMRYSSFLLQLTVFSDSVSVRAILETKERILYSHSEWLTIVAQAHG